MCPRPRRPQLDIHTLSLSLALKLRLAVSLNIDLLMTYPQMQRSEWILQVSQVIFEYGAKYGSQDAYNLGTNLHLISGALKDPYLAILVEEEIPRWPDFIKELEFIFTVWTQVINFV